MVPVEGFPLLFKQLSWNDLTIDVLAFGHFVPIDAIPFQVVVLGAQMLVFDDTRSVEELDSWQLGDEHLSHVLGRVRVVERIESEADLLQAPEFVEFVDGRPL